MLHPFVSVIVPVYNDAERLKLCLTALEAQTYPTDRYEVIVIDNNSTDDVQGATAPYPHAKLIHEAQPGAAAARNAGLHIATGEIIAFTDADCIPANDWLERGVVALTAVPNCGLVGGKIVVFPRDVNHPNFVEVFEHFTAFPQHEYIANAQFAATANMFTSRAIIDRIGMFDANLYTTYGEDSDWGLRVYRAGYVQHYADDVVIRHPARHSLRVMWERNMKMLHAYDTFRADQYTLGWRVRDIFRSGLVPNVRRILNIYRASYPKSLFLKTGAVAVMLFLRYTTAFELIRQLIVALLRPRRLQTVKR